MAPSHATVAGSVAASSAAAGAAASTPAPTVAPAIAHIAELPAGYWGPALHFIIWGGPFTCIAVALSLALLRRRRVGSSFAPARSGRRLLRIERPGDGVFAAAELGKVASSLLSGLLITGVVVPWCVLVIAFGFGAIICAIESWEVDDGIPFLQYGMGILVHPASDVTLSSLHGKLFVLAVGFVTFVLMNTILGIMAMLRGVTAVVAALPERNLPFFLILFIAVPIMLALQTGGLGAILALSTQGSWLESFLAITDFVATGGSFGLAKLPKLTWPMSILLVQVALIITQALGGMVVGACGAHPALASFMTWLEGSDGPEEEEVKSLDSGKEDRKDASELLERQLAAAARERDFWRAKCFEWDYVKAQQLAPEARAAALGQRSQAFV